MLIGDDLRLLASQNFNALQTPQPTFQVPGHHPRPSARAPSKGRFTLRATVPAEERSDSETLQ